MDINTIVTPILLALGAGLAGLITWGFAMLQTWLKEKIKNDKMQLVSTTIINLVRDSVLHVNQTFVYQLKKDGKFDVDNQAKAFNLAFDRIKANLTVEAEAILKDLYGDVEAWISTQIESIIGTYLPHGK